MHSPIESQRDELTPEDIKYITHRLEAIDTGAPSELNRLFQESISQRIQTRSAPEGFWSLSLSSRNRPSKEAKEAEDAFKELLLDCKDWKAIKKLVNQFQIPIDSETERGHTFESTARQYIQARKPFLFRDYMPGKILYPIYRAVLPTKLKEYIERIPWVSKRRHRINRTFKSQHEELLQTPEITNIINIVKQLATANRAITTLSNMSAPPNETGNRPAQPDYQQQQRDIIQQQQRDIITTAAKAVRDACGAANATELLTDPPTTPAGRWTRLMNWLFSRNPNSDGEKSAAAGSPTISATDSDPSSSPRSINPSGYLSTNLDGDSPDGSPSTSPGDSPPESILPLTSKSLRQIEEADTRPSPRASVSSSSSGDWDTISLDNSDDAPPPPKPSTPLSPSNR